MEGAFVSKHLWTLETKLISKKRQKVSNNIFLNFLYIIIIVIIIVVVVVIKSVEDIKVKWKLLYKW